MADETVETPATTTETPAAEVRDVHAWLADLETRIKAKDTTDAAAAAAAERERMAATVADSASKGDAAAIKAALAKLEGHYTGRLGEAQKKEEALLGQVRATVRDAAITRATLGVKFVTEHAQADALARIGAMLEVTQDAQGNFVAKEKGTGRAVAELVKERFGSAEFAHYFPATAGGGIGQGDRPGPTGGTGTGKPDLVTGLAGKIAWQQQQQQRAGMADTPGLRLRSKK